MTREIVPDASRGSDAAVSPVSLSICEVRILISFFKASISEFSAVLSTNFDNSALSVCTAALTVCSIFSSSSTSNFFFFTTKALPTSRQEPKPSLSDVTGSGRPFREASVLRASTTSVMVRRSSSRRSKPCLTRFTSNEVNAVSSPVPSDDGEGLSRSADAITYVPFRVLSISDDFLSFSANRSTLTSKTEVESLRCGTARPLKQELSIRSFRFALIARKISSNVSNDSLPATLSLELVPVR